MTTLRLIIGVELAVAALGGTVFIILYALPSGPGNGRWWQRMTWYQTAAGRHLMALAIVMTGEATTLLAFDMGWPVPLWLFAVGYAGVAVVVVHRLLLLVRARWVHDESP